MKQTVFISRDLPAESFFYKKLIANHFEVFGQSLLAFSAVPFEVPQGVDWLFFYSQNGVRFFFEKIQPDDLPGVKIAAIGPATAAALGPFSRTADFIGDGEPNVAGFLKLAAGQRVLFPRAADSRRSVQQFLGEKLVPLDLIVYQNLPKKNVELPDCNVLVFTSPLNAQAYFSMKKWRDGQLVVAIGNTTGRALQELGLRGVAVAKQATEEALAEAVLGLFSR